MDFNYFGAKIDERKKSVRAPWWHYLLAFLIGWSGAVFSYSDLIYSNSKNVNPNAHISGNEKSSTHVSGDDNQTNQE